MPELMASLPVTGLDGTLRRSRASAGRAHLKTGSLRDVAGVAGYRPRRRRAALRAGGGDQPPERERRARRARRTRAVEPERWRSAQRALSPAAQNGLLRARESTSEPMRPWNDGPGRVPSAHSDRTADIHPLVLPTSPEDPERSSCRWCRWAAARSPGTSRRARSRSHSCSALRSRSGPRLRRRRCRPGDRPAAGSRGWRC